MTDLLERITNLSPAKRALLERRLLQQSATYTERTSIPRRPADAPARLSFAQQRLWFLAQFDPVSTAYHLPKAVRLRGALNVAALQATLDAIVARHESLCTTFAANDGEPLQVIGAPRPVEMPMVDLRAHLQSIPSIDLPRALGGGGRTVAGRTAAVERDAEVQRALLREAARPFDLARDPLLRAMLLRLADDEHVLLTVKHHIAFDALSAAVFHRELSLGYNARVSGQSEALPPLPIQYADFAHWQRERLQGDTLTRELAYWRAQLNDVPPHSRCRPTDRARPCKRTAARGCPSRCRRR